MSYHKRDIFALEAKVKQAYAENKASEQMYLAIKELATAILIVKKMSYDYTEIEEMSHIMATELYVKLNYEDYEVHCWTKYIRLRLNKIRENYLNETRRVELSIDDIVDATRFRDSMFGSSMYAQSSINEFELIDFTEKLSGLVLYIFDKYVRYRSETEEYEFVKLSFMFTIEDRIKHNRGRIVLINLDNSYESYIRFIVNLVYKKLGIYLHRYLGEDQSRIDELNSLVTSNWNVEGD